MKDILSAPIDTLV
jgi:hypothetical protein